MEDHKGGKKEKEDQQVLFFFDWLCWVRLFQISDSSQRQRNGSERREKTKPTRGGKRLLHKNQNKKKRKKERERLSFPFLESEEEM